jgi:hypothetical protein
MKVSRFSGLTLPAVAFCIVSASGFLTAEAQEAALLDPAQTYMQFHDQLPTAKTLDQLSKYFSRARWAQISKDEQIMPKAQFDLTFDFFKKLSPENVSLVSQSLVGDVCILNLKSQDVPGPRSNGVAPDATSGQAATITGTGTNTCTSTGTGTVTMRKEDGQWKIEMEEWQCSETIGAGVDKEQGTAVTSNFLDAAGAAAGGAK